MPQGIERVIDYIEQHLKELTTVKDICDETGLNATYINRHFKSLLNITVLDYIKSRKITEAIKSHNSGRNSIVDIAFEYGFNSHEVFIRNCRRYFSHSPRELLTKDGWMGREKINIDLFLYRNITEKLIRLPELILRGDKDGPFTLLGENFTGIKSSLEWNPGYTYKLIPKGVYRMILIEQENDNVILSYIKEKYPNTEFIIKYLKNDRVLYYF